MLGPRPAAILVVASLFAAILAWFILWLRGDIASPPSTDAEIWEHHCRFEFPAGHVVLGYHRFEEPQWVYGNMPGELEALVTGWKSHVAFVHSRKILGKKPPRLVLCDVRAAGPSGPRELAVIRVRGHSAGPRHEWTEPSGDQTAEIHVLRSISSVVCYPGQPDPADESHFTIKYEIDDKPGTIDGSLQADDTVKLQIRDGPAL